MEQRGGGGEVSPGCERVAGDGAHQTANNCCGRGLGLDECSGGTAAAHGQHGLQDSDNVVHSQQHTHDVTATAPHVPGVRELTAERQVL